MGVGVDATRHNQLACCINHSCARRGLSYVDSFAGNELANEDLRILYIYLGKRPLVIKNLHSFATMEMLA